MEAPGPVHLGAASTRWKVMVKGPVPVGCAKCEAMLAGGFGDRPLIHSGAARQGPSEH